MAPVVVRLKEIATGVTKTYLFKRSPIRIGRAPSMDLMIARVEISNVHAELSFDDRGVTYVDRDPGNRTLLDGSEIPPDAAAVELRPGAELVLGGAIALTVERDRSAQSPRNGRSVGA